MKLGAGGQGGVFPHWILPLLAMGCDENKKGASHLVVKGAFACLSATWHCTVPVTVIIKAEAVPERQAALTSRNTVHQLRESIRAIAAATKLQAAQLRYCADSEFIRRFGSAEH
ncbi:hypothetical protein [Geomonas silvestris]|uniref:hypothetical protein n=1 Tax=Geomonas silvestris TaxID=2740184 RepID=UPI001614537B|nr:hypothetical protein [Geomonas silvestris]